MASYATPAQMLQRYDARTIGDLVSDDGNRIDPTELLTDVVLQAQLNDASGEIETNLLQGERYQVSDLEALTGNTQFTLIRLTCDIAMRLLSERRPWYELNEAYTQRLEQSNKTLEQLRKGTNVFNVTANIEASQPKVDTPSIQSINSLNLTVDAARRGYYPARRLPRPQG